MMTIRVFIRELEKDGRKYYIKETTDFGFKVSISSKVKPYKGNDGFYYMNYNAEKAYMACNEKGYLTLYISE